MSAESGGVYVRWGVCAVVCMFRECTYSLAPNGCGCIIIIRWWFLSPLHARALFRPGEAFDANSEWTTLLVRRALITPPWRQMHNILQCSSAQRALITWASEMEDHDQITILLTIRLIQNQKTLWLEDFVSCLSTRKQFHDIKMENINCTLHSSVLFRMSEETKVSLATRETRFRWFVSVTAAS